ncbi:MAG: class I SAM-dependent methyltransferase [Actinomycetales bacterium]
MPGREHTGLGIPRQLSPRSGQETSRTSLAQLAEPEHEHLADEADAAVAATATAASKDPDGDGLHGRVGTGLMLLVEVPKVWAANPEDSLGDLARPMRDLARRCDAAISLIRRPEQDAGRTRTVFCSTAGHDGLLVRREIDSLSDLGELRLDSVLDQVRAGQVPDGWEEAEPILLVTVVGQRRRSEVGPMLAAELHRYDPDNIWECSADIGDSGRLCTLALPVGFVHRDVSVSDAGPLIQSLWQQRSLPDLFAGRTHHTPELRLAEVTLRNRLGATPAGALTPIEVSEAQIATGDHEDAAIRITRVVTRWRVYPTLVSDPALALMVPTRVGQPTRSWRVVIDRSSLVGDNDSHLSVIEVADEDEPGDGVHAWDAANSADQGPLLPDPTVVAEISSLRPGRALDLGCGSGRHALWLAEQGWQVTGVDFSRSGLWRLADEAGRRNLAVRAELADMRVWTPGGQGFDLVLACNVSLENVFQRCAGWLSPTGRIVLVQPVADEDATQPTTDGVKDYVFYAARATGARLRVLRAGEVERVTDHGVQRDFVIVAARPS